MDWKHDRQALKRIVALLFALGLLAERAAAKPRPLRAAVLWLLRAAETVGRKFVLEQFQEKWEPVFRLELRKNKEIEQFQEKWEPVFRPELRENKALAMVDYFGGRSGLPASPPALDVADDALRLAQSFRALAELLTYVLRCGLASPPNRPRVCLAGDHPRKTENLGQMPALVASVPPDTS